ncbi:DsbA family protein [Paenibacillaceae bacterium]|nr:DsbA family protein [Paenibacillaceae bacterium]
MNTKKRQSKGLVIFTIIFVALIVLVYIVNQQTTKNTDDQGYTTFSETPSIEGQPILGQADAPVTIVEFGDYMCPGCKVWGERVLPSLMKDYIDQGKVKFSFVNVLFHGEESRIGALASEAVLEQSEELFWTFHHELYNAQPTQNHDEKWLTNEKALEIAAAIPGIDVAKVEDALVNKTTQPQVDIDEILNKKYKVKLTPSIMINNVMVNEPFNYEKITEIIEEQLKK